MKLNHFFRVSWVLQLLVGIGLFTVSFVIEKQILSTFLESSILALILAIALELGKAVAIVWHRYMTYQTTNNYPAITRITSNAFRIGLVVFSLICSLLFMSNHFDRPHKETLRSAETSDAKSKLDDTLAALDATHQQRRADLKSKQDKEYEDLKAFHNLRITELKNEMRTEMDNSVRGHFKGPRYKEFELQLTQEKVAMTAALEAQSKRFFSEMETWAKNSTAELNILRKEARNEHDQKHEMILNKSYDSDERAHDPTVVAFINLMESVLDTGMEPLQFVFIFSILLCVLMELGIILAFDTVTLSVLPVLAKQHHSEQQSETFKGEVVGEVSRENAYQNSVLRTIK